MKHSDPYRIRHKTVLGQAYAFLGGGAPNVSAPPPRNLTNEMLQTLSGYQQTAGPYLGLSQQYQPAYGGLNLQLLQEQLFGTQGTPGQTQTIQVPHVNAKGQITRYDTRTISTPGTGAAPGTVALGQQAATSQRAADLADVQRFGLPATQAYLAANPYLAPSLNTLQAREAGLQSQQAGLQAQLQSPLMRGLESEAQQQLAAGGQLTPQEQDTLRQQTLAGAQQAGMATGGGALGAELLNQDAYQRARMQQAQQFAQGVQGLGFGETAQSAQLALQNAQEAGQASQIFQSTLSDPYQAILGRSSGAGLGGLGGGGGGGGAGQSIAAAQQLFNPMSSYAADVYNTNYNANAAANIANANYQSAQNAGYLGLAGAGLGALGNIAGGYFQGGETFSDKRLKTDIKKVGVTDEGIPIKTFRYKGGKHRYRGVIADDVQEKFPERVHVDKSGFKMVDFSSGTMPFDFMRGNVRRAA